MTAGTLRACMSSKLRVISAGSIALFQNHHSTSPRSGAGAAKARYAVSTSGTWILCHGRSSAALAISEANSNRIRYSSDFAARKALECFRIVQRNGDVGFAGDTSIGDIALLHAFENPERVRPL